MTPQTQRAVRTRHGDNSRTGITRQNSRTRRPAARQIDRLRLLDNVLRIEAGTDPAEMRGNHARTNIATLAREKSKTMQQQVVTSIPPSPTRMTRISMTTHRRVAPSIERDKTPPAPGLRIDESPSRITTPGSNKTLGCSHRKNGSVIQTRAQRSHREDAVSRHETTTNRKPRREATRRC